MKNEISSLNVFRFVKSFLGCIHYVSYRGGGAEDFFFSGSFFYIPPQGPYKFSEPPKQSAEKLIPPLPPPKKYQNKYLYNSKLYMFEISRDMFNKNLSTCTVLADSSGHSRARHHDIECK